MDKKINVNHRSGHSGSPLNIASRLGIERVAQILIANEEVDVNSTAHLGETPLSSAVEFGYERIVAMLLGDLNSKETVTGRTPLSFAVMGSHSVVVRLPLSNDGVRVDRNDNKLRISLQLAMENGNEEVV